MTPRNSVKANQLHKLRKLYQDGSLSAGSAEERVVPTIERLASMSTSCPVMATIALGICCFVGVKAGLAPINVTRGYCVVRDHRRCKGARSTNPVWHAAPKVVAPYYTAISAGVTPPSRSNRIAQITSERYRARPARPAQLVSSLLRDGAPPRQGQLR